MNETQIKKLKSENNKWQKHAGAMQSALSMVWTDLFPDGPSVDWGSVTLEVWLDDMYQEFRAKTPVNTMHEYRNQCEIHEQEIASLKAQLAEHDEAMAAELELVAAGVDKKLITRLKKGK